MIYPRKTSRKGGFWICPKCSRRHDLVSWDTDLQIERCDGCGFVTTVADIFTTKRKQELSKLKKEDQIIQMLSDLQESISALRSDVITMHRLVENIANR